jgi:hypothetical protein
LPSEESAREETEVSLVLAVADDPAPAALELTGEPSREKTWHGGASTRLMFAHARNTASAAATGVSSKHDNIVHARISSLLVRRVAAR